MSKPTASAVVDLVERGMRMHPCPGYKRPCGVNTLRKLCWFCRRTKDLEREKR
jgi:hypothetical protein